jgi:hypothetical protein
MYRVPSAVSTTGSGRETWQFLGEFTKLQKVTLRFVISFHLSIQPIWYIFMRFDIWAILENLLRKFKFQSNLSRIIGTFTWRPMYIYGISRWILFRMRNISDKSCREYQNTHFMFYNFFPKIVPLMRYCGKNIVETDRPQIIYNIIWHMRIACWIPKATDTH